MSRMRQIAKFCLLFGLAIVVGLNILARLLAQQPATAPATPAAPANKSPHQQKAADNKAAKAPSGKFLRVQRDKKGTATSLDTGIAHYKNPAVTDGPIVDLISAVHVGEKKYYEELNKLFEKYDAVLYELVAEEGTRVPKGGGERRGVISGIQGGLKDMLELEFQLEQVDYQKENLVHADLSPEKFAAAMKERGETMLSMMFRMMGQSMAMQGEMQAKGKNTDMEILMALFSKDRPLKLKRAMAGQFENMELFTQAMGGPDGSTIIEGRNAACLEVLKKELDAGKKKIAIFYGAGHMTDMEKQLAKKFELQFTGEDWLEAWDMRDKPAAAKPAPRRAPAAGNSPK
ncbi:MAG: hypothetical protein SFX18_09930 [Pirellulales bacterium]|nr:hypothetical protein [Pirellulales bacterium]